MSISIASMSPADIGAGTISYGSFTFGVLRYFDLKNEQVYDDAGRTVIANDYTLTVTAFVNNDSLANESTAINSIRGQLTLAGQQLTLTGVGCGDIVVNGFGGNFKDIQWGPKPISLQITNAGGGLTYEITWTVKFRIFDQQIYRNIVAWNYSVSYSFSDAGLCTRVIDGYFQVPITRDTFNEFAVTTTADAQRDTAVSFSVPAGFGRTAQNFQLSPDRTRENFVVIDTQLDCMDESPPPNALRADLDFDLQSVGPGFAQSSVTLSGEIEVPVGRSPSEAAVAFVLIALDRWNKLQNSFNASAPATVIPTALHAGRKLFTRRSRFLMSWIVTGCLTDLLNQGGIWSRVGNWSPGDWQQSILSSGAWSVRGFAGLAYSANDDAIIDLGSPGQPGDITDGGSSSTPSPASTSNPFSLQSIDPELSWLSYSNHLKAYRERKAVVHKQAQTYTPTNPDGTSNVSSTDIAMPDLQGVTYSDTWQDQGQPTDMVVMQGKAMRVQYPPSIPNLVAVSGVPVEEVKRVVEGPRPIGCIFGTTVYSARWAILYRVQGYTGSMRSDAAETNPVLCCESSPNVE